jgi:hypothetical protein
VLPGALRVIVPADAKGPTATAEGMEHAKPAAETEA